MHATILQREGKQRRISLTSFTTTTLCQFSIPSTAPRFLAHKGPLRQALSREPPTQILLHLLQTHLGCSKREAVFWLLLQLLSQHSEQMPLEVMVAHLKLHNKIAFAFLITSKFNTACGEGMMSVLLDFFFLIINKHFIKSKQTEAQNIQEVYK